MRLIIIGAEAVGIALVGLAAKADHDVVVIEPDSQRAEYCADQYDVTVLNIGISDEEVSEESDLAKADAVIAATMDDSTNLMAMFLAREHGVDRRASIVNHASHKTMFERLGVNMLTDPEFLVAQHLLDLVLLPQSVDVTTLQDREQIMEVVLGAQSALAGQTPKDIQENELLNKDLFIISAERDGKSFFLKDDTELQPGDELIVFSRRPIERKDVDVFIGTE